MTRPLTEERRNLHDALCSLPSRREKHAERATHDQIATWRQALRRALVACNIVLGEAEPPTEQAIADWRQAARDWRRRAEGAEAILLALTGRDVSSGDRVDVPSVRQAIFAKELERLAPVTLPDPQSRQSWVRAVASTREACARIAEAVGGGGKSIAAVIRKGDGLPKNALAIRRAP